MDGMQPQLSPDAPSKLTSWKKEPTIQDLKADFEAARPYHQAHIEKVQRWQNLLDVKGEARPPKVKGRSNVQPKMIRRQAEWRYSALTEPFLSSQKLFSVSPVTFEDEAAAKQNELVLNYQFRTKLNRVKFFDDYVRSTVDEGTCVVQVGWRRHTVKVKEEMPVWTLYEIQTAEQAQLLQQAVAMKQENPREFDEKAPADLKAAIDHYEETGQAVYAVQTGTYMETVEKVIENQPTLVVRDLRNVYIDPSCQGDLNQALFVVVSFETNKAELMKEGKRYKNLDRVNWEGATPIVEPDHETKTPQDFNFRDASRKKVVAYEYWGFFDVEGNDSLTPFVATWIGDTLIRMELNPFPDGKLPFVVVPYLPIKRELYGEPDAELLEDNQKILGATMRGMIDLLGRSANGQQGIAKGMLDPVNRRRYENGLDYEFNPNMHPANAIIEHKFPELPQSALQMVLMQNQEAEALSGVKAFSGGLSGESYGNVATAIRGVLDAASKREMAILRRLAKGMTEIGQKFIAMNGAFLSDKEVIRVTNTQFVEVRREDLAGNFDLEVDISTAEVDNAKAQDLGFMLQTIGPNVGPELTMVIMAEIADLKRMPALAHKLRNWKPQPDPLMEQMKQLELQKLQMEIQELQSRAQLNMAKASESSANADRTNLDFVEQESGTAHARDMEKQKAQSEGNQNLEVVKALTKPVKEGEKKPNIEAAIGYAQLSNRLNQVN